MLYTLLLDAYEVARRFTPSKKVVNRLDQPRAQKSQAFHHTERPGFFLLNFHALK